MSGTQAQATSPTCAGRTGPRPVPADVPVLAKVLGLKVDEMVREDEAA